MKLQLPNQKAFAAGIGGIATWAIVAGLGYFGIVVPPAEQTGIVGLVTLALATFVPASDQDILKGINDDIAQAGTIVGKLTPASDSTVPPTPAAKALATKA